MAGQTAETGGEQRCRALCRKAKQLFRTADSLYDTFIKSRFYFSMHCTKKIGFSRYSLSD
jgi:hypothetical protein